MFFAEWQISPTVITYKTLANASVVLLPCCHLLTNQITCNMLLIRLILVRSTLFYIHVLPLVN